MPLPRRYFDIQEEDKNRVDRDRKRMERRVNPTLPSLPTFDEVMTSASKEENWGSAWDFIGQTGLGLASGITWGATEFLEPEMEEGEERTRLGQAGRIIGETAGLFAPGVGPFALMGKAGSAITRKVAKEGVENIIGRAATSAGKVAAKSNKESINVIKAAAVIAKNTGRKTSSILSELDNTVKSGLLKSGTDKNNLRWIYNLKGNSDQRREGLQALTARSQAAIRKAFKDVGVEDIGADDLKRISDDYMDFVGSGRHINELSEWIATKFAGESAGPLRDLLGKYLGMASQDVMMMGAHGLISGAVMASARGEEFGMAEAGHVANHSLLMGLAFPIIRGIPGGGKESLARKVKLLKSSYNGSNYAKITKESGEEATKGLLRVMLKGGKFDVLNSSELAKRHWKVGGTTYKNAEDIFRKLDQGKVPMDHVHSLLNSVRDLTTKKLNKEWYSKYALDFMKSSPRMAVGVGVMNYGLFATGAFADLNPEELGVHLLMSAVMTKSRGHWGREDLNQYMADFTPEMETLHLLGVSGDGLKDVINMYKATDIQSKFGSSINTHPTGAEIHRLFNEAFNNKSFTGTSKEFDPLTYRLVNELNDINKMMDTSQQDPGRQGSHTPKDARFLGKDGLAWLESQLRGLTFEDGTRLESLHASGVQSRLTQDTANGVWNIYRDMFLQLSDNIGLKIEKLANNRLGIDDITWDNSSNISDIRNLILKFHDSGYIDIGSSVRKYKLTPDAEKIVEETIEFTKGVLNREHGVGNYNFDILENPYTDLVRAGKASESLDKMFNIMTRKTTEEIGSVADEGLGISADDLFSVTDNGRRYRRSINDYEIVFGDREIKDFNTNQLRDRSDSLRDSLAPLFELMKFTTGSPSRNIKGKTEINYKDARILAEQFDTFRLSMPVEMRASFSTVGKDYFIKRVMETRNYDRRALNTIMEIKDKWNLPVTQEGKIYMFSEKSLDRMLGPETTEANRLKATEMYKDIIRAVGRENIEFADYIPENTAADVFRKFDIEDIASIHSTLKDQAFQDFLNFGKESLANIKFEGSNLEKRLFQLQLDIGTLGEDIGKSGYNHEKALQKIKDEVDILSLKNKDSDKSEMRDNNKELFDTVLTQLDIVEKRMKRIPDEGVELFKADDSIVSVNEVISKLIDNTKISTDKFTGITEQIINNTRAGKEGYSRSESEDYYNMLTKELMRELKGMKDKEVSFDDLVAAYNETGSWSKFMDLAESVNIRIAQARKRKDPHAEEFDNVYEELVTSSIVESSSKNPMEVAKKYNLLSIKDPNKYDETFSELVAEGRFIEAGDHAAKKIDELPNLSVKEKLEFLDEWVEKDSQFILLRLNNAESIPTMSFKKGVTEIGDKAGRKNVNSNFFNRVHQPDGDVNKYEVYFLDNTMVVTQADGRDRTLSINDLVGGPDKVTPGGVYGYIMQAINNSKMAPGELRNFVNERLATGEPVTSADIKNWGQVGNTSQHYLTFMNLSPKSKILFVGSRENIDLLNKDYEAWYNSKLTYYNKKDRALGDAFKGIFGDVASRGDSSKSLELKMLMMHSDHTMRGEFDKMVTKIKDNAPSVDVRKVLANMYKRGGVADGGTSNVVGRELNRYIRDISTDADVVRLAKKFAKDPNALKIGLIADERKGVDDLGNSISDPFHNKQRVIRGIDERLKDPNISDFEKASLNQHKSDVENNIFDSLNSSSVDGGLPISREYAKYLWAANGGRIEDFNGMKPYVMSVGSGNNLLGKGFFYYDPSIRLPRGVHMLVPESAAKSIAGISEAGKEIVPLRIDKSSNDWMSELRGISKDNIMGIDFSSVGIGFTGKQVDKVTISNSTGDLQSSGYVAELRAWQGLENIIDRLDKIHKDHSGAKQQIAEYLFQLKEDQGFQYTQGAMGLAKAMVQSRLSIENPVLKTAVDRLIRSKDFELIKRPNTTSGEDALIVPNSKGDLFNPNIVEVQRAELYKEGSEVVTDRINATHGQLGVSHYMMDRIRHRDISKYSFVYNDAGIDVVISYDGKKFKAVSPLHDKYAGFNIRGDATGIKVPKRDDVKLNKIKKVLESINSIQNLSALNVHNLIKNGVLTKNGQTYVLSKLSGIKKVELNKLNLELGASGIAIPLKGYDKAYHRIGKILNKDKNGLVEINDYDTRIIHQRDYDGDHFYVYLDKPINSIAEDISVNGRIKDFRQYKGEMHTSNQFGFGLDPKGRGDKFVAGEISDDIGHSRYSAEIHEKTKAIGANIGNRNALSFLMRTGFKNVKDKTEMYDLNEIKDLESGADEFGIALRMLYTMQTGVDVNNPTPIVMNPAHGRNTITNFAVLGQRPTEGMGGKIEDPLTNNASRLNIFKKGWDPEVIEGQKKLKHWTDQPIGRDIVRVVLRTLKKSNAITNETYDEAGRRPPEPAELRRIVHNLRSFFANPDQFLISELVREYAAEPDISAREKKLNDLMGFFYGFKADPVQNAIQRTEFIKNLRQGKGWKLPQPRRRFEFKKDISNEPDIGQKLKIASAEHLGAHSLAEMVNRKFYTDFQYSDYVNTDNKLFRNAGIAVDDIVNRVQFLHLFGEDVTAGDFEYGSLVKFEKSVYNDNMVNRGLIHNILEVENNNLANRLRYLAEERFTNPEKITSMRNRKDAIIGALDSFNKQYYDNLVAKDSKANVRTPITFSPEQKAARVFFKNTSPMGGKKTYVYKVRANFFNPKDGTIDWKKIERVGWVDPKSHRRSEKTYKREEGWYYIETTRPSIRESVNSAEAKYSDALMKLTYPVGDESAVIGDYQLRLQFLDAVGVLKSELTSNYSDTMGVVKKNRSMADQQWATSSAREESIIREFFHGDKSGAKRGWIERLTELGVGEADSYEFLLHHIIKPRALTGRYKTVTMPGEGKRPDSIDLPFYGMNKRLIRTMLRYYYNTKGVDKIADKFAREWERIASGGDISIDEFIAGHQMMYTGKYNFNKLGENMTFIKSLLGPGFHSPWVEIQANRHGLEHWKTSTMKGGDGKDKYIVRKPKKAGKVCK